MPTYSVKKIGDMQATAGGVMRRARAELGVSAFGMQIEELPPQFDRYPEHSHSEDGQEEVYVVLHGSGEIDIEGERIALDPETLVRVSAGTSRKIFPGPDGMRVLVIGGVPGAAYEPTEFSKLAAADPLAAH